MDTPKPSRPAYREPWKHGAYAYPQADNFEALKEGTKRKRKSLTVHMPNSGEAGDMLCATCGIKLRDPYPANPGEEPTKVDKNSTWHYNPRTKRGYGQHYGCSWASLFAAIVASDL